MCKGPVVGGHRDVQGLKEAIVLAVATFLFLSKGFWVTGNFVT